MANVTFKGNPIQTIGDLPRIGAAAPSFELTKSDLSDVRLSDFMGKKVVMNIFHSLDTSTCAASVRRFNEELNKLNDTVVLCISADLPFAQSRFCGAEGLDNVLPLSVFRSANFGKDYGVLYISGSIRGLLARSILVLDRTGRVSYTEQVAETSQEPNYEGAIAAVKAIA